ncbi:hypothetical protein Esti_006724 [Eimeria stiedai]
MTAASRVLAAALLLVSSSPPFYQHDREAGALSPASSWTDFGVVFAAANDDQNDEETSTSEERHDARANPPADEDATQEEGKAAPGALRGTSANKRRAAAREELASVFQGLLSSLSPERESSLLELSKQTEQLNELLDTIFPSRLQAAPRYMGALEVVNEALYRDMLRGPGKEERSPASLQQAYSYLRKRPLVLVVPALFIELREGADRRQWEEERQLIHRRCERNGEAVPPRYELSADEVHAQEIENGALWDDELAAEDLQLRIQVINGWLKQQYRLRLYSMKRRGTLKGNPQDMMSGFNPGPDLVTVSPEDIEGLSYAAELDDAHASSEETEESGLSSNIKRQEAAAQQSEL